MNSSNIGGNGMMYGGNFIDIMFKNIMEGGISQISFVMFFNFYLYLSLDKIKDLLKSFNDKLSEKVKMCMESYGYTYFEYIKIIFSKVMNLIKFKYDIIKRVNDNKEKEDKMDYSNAFSIKINPNNKIDLMAIGNYILEHRNQEVLMNVITRDVSDRHKTTEVYRLPNNFIIKSNKTDDIMITMNQNVEMKLVNETDNKIELLKDVIVDLKKHETRGYEQFKSDYLNWAQQHGHIRKYKWSQMPIQLDTSYGVWVCAPDEMLCGYYPTLLHLLYYSKNYTVLKQLMLFLLGYDEFIFDGIRYKNDIKGGNGYMPGYFTNTKEKDEASKRIDDDYIKNIDKLIDDNKNKMSDDTKKSFDTLVSNTVSLFTIIDDNIIELTFKDSNKEELSENEKKERIEGILLYSRQFLNNLIMNYYQHDINKIGDNISIYQLKIEHYTEVQKTENPKYKKWLEKEEKNKKTEKNEDDKQKEEEKKKEEKKKEDKSDDHPMFMFGGYHKSYKYNKKPKQFIKETLNKTKVNSIHIKSDKKPIQYLYLQQDIKNDLITYLTHFKNNKHLYHEFGISYKGGIILSGEPGCGKTSSIIACATYLSKDIYYIDLSQIKTNTDLKLCMEYISKQSKQGGVVIFEDIDCMTDIVKKRNDNNNHEQQEYEKIREPFFQNKNEENDKLSLSFLLNVLDGTMSPQDVLFIITTNHINVLDPAIFRSGRMDINVELKKCDKYQLKCIYQDMYKKTLSNDILDKFKEYEFITSEVIMHLFHNIYSDIPENELFSRFLRGTIDLSSADTPSLL